MKLDLSKFKKISHDKTHTTFKHSDGHEVRVAHSALTPKMRSELAAMPLHKEPAQSNPKLEESKKELGHPEVFKDGGTVQKMAEGGQAPLDIAPVDAQGEEPVQEIDLPPAPSASTQPPMAAPPTAQAPAPTPADQAATDIMGGTAPAEAPAASTTTPAGATGPAVAPKSPTAAGPDMMSNIQKGVGLEWKAAELKQKAEENLGASIANVQQGHAQEIQKLNDQAKARQDAFMKSQEALAHDIQAGYIHPARILENMNAFQKVSTAIGLLLGGIGGGMTGQENPVAKFLNQQMERDFEAQKAQRDQKLSLYAHNNAMFNNEREADIATRVAINDTYSAIIDKQLALARGPQAAATAAALKGQLLKQNAVWINQIGPEGPVPGEGGAQPPGSSKAGAQPQSGSPTAGVEAQLNQLRWMNPEQAKEIESRLIPGVGVAATPIDPAVKTRVVEMNNLRAKVDDLINFQKQYGGTVRGRIDPRIRAQGQTLLNEVQNQYRMAGGMGVFKRSEAEFVSDLVGGNPADFLSKFTHKPKYEETKRLMEQTYDTTLRGIGIQPRQQAQSSGQQTGFRAAFTPRKQ